MPRQCKVCSLTPDLKGVIDKQLLDGVLNRQVASFLNNRGIEITTPSIDRHKKNCLGIESTPNKNTVNEKIDSEDIEDLDVESVMNDAFERANYKDVNNSIAYDVVLATILLSDIFRNQLAVLKIAQEKFISGKGHYPKDMYRDLQLLVGIQNDVSIVYNRKYNERLKEIYDAKNAKTE